LPPQGGRQIESAWEPVLAELEARAMDIAVVPLDAIPARFAECVLYEEDFVIATRARHPFAAKPSLERYCEMQHLLVSLTGDPYGFVDQALAKLGAARRIAVAVPNFMMALALVPTPIWLQHCREASWRCMRSASTSLRWKHPFRFRSFGYAPSSQGWRG
jgi:DNA-binding transcriptional LysR family regulator